MNQQHISLLMLVSFSWPYESSDSIERREAGEIKAEIRPQLKDRDWNGGKNIKDKI